MQIKKLWNFLWYNNSPLSWIINIILALVVVKFIIYPGAGLLLSTTYPMVAVVSSSMEHTEQFDQWWEQNKDWYLKKDITKEDFKKYSFNQGFNKGDIMVLFGTDNIKVGDVVVYDGSHQYPIIHRVIKKELTENGYNYKTKGDNNPKQDPIIVSDTVGKAIFRIPFLGYTKIIFTKIIEVIT